MHRTKSILTVLALLLLSSELQAETGARAQQDLSLDVSWSLQMGLFLEMSLGVRGALTTHPDIYEFGIEFVWWQEPVPEDNAAGVYFGNYLKLRPIPIGFLGRFYLLGDIQHWILHHGGSSFSVYGMGLGYHQVETEQELVSQGLRGMYVELSVQIPFGYEKDARYIFIPMMVMGFTFE